MSPRRTKNVDSVEPRAPSGFQWQARVVLQCGGVESGRITNAWNFIWAGTGSPSTTDQNTICTAVRDFYIANIPAGNQLSSFMSSQVNTTSNVHLVELYNVDTADIHHALGSPIMIKPFTMSAMSPNPIPNEVAVVLSMRAAYGSDPEHAGTSRPRASDRGRVYIGPLGTAALTTTPGTGATSYSTVATNLQSTLINNVKNLKSTASTGNWLLAVWSRKEQVFKQVTQYSVEANFDTQRRRSLAAPLLTWTPFP